MIIILKIILGIMAFFNLSVLRTLLIDYRRTIKTENFDDSTIITKMRLKSIFFISIFALIVFFMLLIYYLFSPIAIKW